MREDRAIDELYERLAAAEIIVAIARRWRHQERIGEPNVGMRILFTAVDEYEATL